MLNASTNTQVVIILNNGYNGLSNGIEHSCFYKIQLTQTLYIYTHTKALGHTNLNEAISRKGRVEVFNFSIIIY